jgi:hypothetical protein
MGVEETVTAPVGWAKAKPLAFFLLLFIVVLLTLRFRHAIARWIAKIPKLGPWLVGGKASVVPATSNTPAATDASS